MIKYLDFINEVMSYEMRIGYYVFFNSNIRNSQTPTKGKYAKIIKNSRPVDGIREFTLEFETPLIVKIKDDNGNIIGNQETNTLKINSNQIKTLIVIPPEFIDLHKTGFNMKYTTSSIFGEIMTDLRFPIRNNQYLDVSYFDIDHEKDDFVTYLPYNKIKQSQDSNENPYESKYRQSSKIGRIFKKLNDKLTDQQIENFVHEYKATWKIIKGDVGDKLKIVSGKEIPYWYLVDKYVPGNGTLNNSCMRYPSTQERVNFYSRFPEKISMAILLDDNDKLLARALIWKLDEPEGVIFMDRIYFVKICHSKILENYAHKNNIKTKTEGWNLRNKMTVNLSYNTGEPMPYLDSFRWDQSTNKLVNK